MPPRFMERMQRQSDTIRKVFGEPLFDPPPYPNRQRTTSTATSATGQSDWSAAAAPPPPYHRSMLTKPTIDTPSLPKNSLVLVTAANCWQGIHIVDQLLEHGYRVRGTVRDADNAVWTAKFFGDKYGPGRYTTAIIPDMAVSGAYDIAAKGCSGIIHVASIMTFSSDPYEVIPQTIMGAMNALEAAAKEPQVTRFVYCSSVTAATNPGEGQRNDVTGDSWNMSAFKAAWEPPPYDIDRAWNVFASSKMQTEQAVWKWCRDRKPNFVLNCVLPDMLWGQVLDSHQPGTGISMHVLKAIYTGDAASVLWTPPQYFADVQDSALVHVAALILPGVMNERLFVTATPYNIPSVQQLLRGLYPKRDFPSMHPDHDHGVDMSYYKTSGRAEELLRRMGKQAWTDIETSVSRACEAFI